jgi:hypothetical protein
MNVLVTNDILHPGMAAATPQDRGEDNSRTPM